MKLFLDTNALLDYYTQRQPFFEDMKKLRIAQYCGDVEFWASIPALSAKEWLQLQENQGITYDEIEF